MDKIRQELGVQRQFSIGHSSNIAFAFFLIPTYFPMAKGHINCKRNPCVDSAFDSKLPTGTGTIMTGAKLPIRYLQNQRVPQVSTDNWGDLFDKRCLPPYSEADPANRFRHRLRED